MLRGGLRGFWEVRPDSGPVCTDYLRFRFFSRPSSHHSTERRAATSFNSLPARPARAGFVIGQSFRSGSGSAGHSRRSEGSSHRSDASSRCSEASSRRSDARSRCSDGLSRCSEDPSRRSEGGSRGSEGFSRREGRASGRLYICLEQSIVIQAYIT
jgi:hypothetical protein